MAGRCPVEIGLAVVAGLVIPALAVQWIPDSEAEMAEAWYHAVLASPLH
jgi:hypothetical protein